MTAAVRARRAQAGTGTRRGLLRLRGWLVVSTLVVLTSAGWATAGIQHTAETVHTNSSQALLEVTAAKEALVTADRAAVRSFRTGEAQLAGPGEQYQNQVAVASQSLARVAELNQAGSSGSELLQVVEGLVAAYTGAIGHADAHHRQDNGTLGAADLWYASRLLHADGGVLDQLDTLAGEQRHALERQLASGWLRDGMWLLWLAPLLALLGLLGWTQLHLARTFRRRVNPALLVGTALLAGLGIAMASAAGAEQRLHDAKQTLGSVLDGWRVQIDSTDAAGQRELAGLLTERCGQGGTCGPTVESFVAGLTDPGAVPEDWQLTEQIRALERQTAAAADSGARDVLVPAGALGIAALVLIGLHARIEEYRYSP